MPYQINRYNNQSLVTIQDGTVDNSTSLRLVGKNFAGYGEIHNENFVHLLENFSNPTAPPRALSGQTWYDSVNKKLKFYTGNAWKSTGGFEAGSARPAGLAEGDFWWDTSNQQLYVYNGESFVLIGPQTTGSGITQMITREIFDIGNNIKTVIAATVEDTVVAIISPETFQASTTVTDLSKKLPTGFDSGIKKGIVLPGTPADGITTSDFRFWGTASNAERLGGIAASSYVTQDQLADNQVDTINIDNSFRIYIDILSRAVLEHKNKTSSQIIFSTTPTNDSQTTVTPLVIDNRGLTPGPSFNNVFDIGTESVKWKNVYATEFRGLASVAQKLKIGLVEVEGSVAATPNTVAVRDGAGNLFANIFEGIATSAKYADLAEKYTTDKEYPIGTLLTVCSHNDHELESAKKTDIVIGTVSENPAYLMNAESEGQAVALKGRVPVRVVGSIKKGQPVYAWNNGVASTVPTGAIVAIALETNTQVEEKLVECVLKV